MTKIVNHHRLHLTASLLASVLFAVVPACGDTADSKPSGDAALGDARNARDAGGTDALTDAALAEDGARADAALTQAQRVCARWNADTLDLGEGAWTGDVSSCVAGDNVVGRENALRLVNLYRWLADLPPASTTEALNSAAQECALLLAANNQLTHNPLNNWDCYTAQGASTAGLSSIAGSPGVSAVDQYMIDRGNEATMGDRRWILSNSTGEIGLGSALSYSCMTLLGSNGGATAPWTAWPAPGVFPYGAVQMGGSSVDVTGWTLQSSSINLSAAQIEVASAGQSLPVTVSTLQNGYGSIYALSFVPDGWTTQAGSRYSVSVTGISPVISYEVEVVLCN